MKSATVTRSSTLHAPPGEVWLHATSLDGIHRELSPWMRMTAPAEARGLSLDGAQVPLGEPLFTSWILLLGFFPVERMRLTLVELEPGRRFVEQSGTTFMRLWRHERTVEAAPAGCTITDKLTLAAPLVLFTPLVAKLIGYFFNHRHRRLRRLFN